MNRHSKDKGIVIKKQKLLNSNYRIVIFSEAKGKLSLFAYGIKKITSRRLSHLETGNYLTFDYYTKDSHASLRETELIYGYSKIKTSEEKLEVMFLIFFILNKILPEDQPEEAIYKMTLEFLKQLNNKEVTVKEIEAFLTTVLELSGFVDPALLNKDTFDVLQFVEELIGQKIRFR